MGRIGSGQPNLAGPPPPQQAQGGVPVYPPQPHQPPPPPQPILQQPPQPVNYNQVPINPQYGAVAGFAGVPTQAAQVGSPMQPGGANFVQQNNYNNNAYYNASAAGGIGRGGGGGMQFPQQQGRTYPGSAGLQFGGRGGYAGTRPWNTGLFDCMQDPSNAFVTAIFPCVTFGQIADVLDNGHTTCATSGIIYGFSPCMLSRPYRTKLRRKFDLVEAPYADWIAHSMFEPCALCQEYRELNSRGIDPALGYHGNKERLQNQLAASGNPPMMVPPQNQTMS